MNPMCFENEDVSFLYYSSIKAWHTCAYMTHSPLQFQVINLIGFYLLWDCRGIFTFSFLILFSSFDIAPSLCLDNRLFILLHSSDPPITSRFAYQLEEMLQIFLFILPFFLLPSIQAENALLVFARSDRHDTALYQIVHPGSPLI